MRAKDSTVLGGRAAERDRVASGSDDDDARGDSDEGKNGEGDEADNEGEGLEI